MIYDEQCRRHDTLQRVQRKRDGGPQSRKRSRPKPIYETSSSDDDDDECDGDGAVSDSSMQTHTDNYAAFSQMFALSRGPCGVSHWRNDVVVAIRSLSFEDMYACNRAAEGQWHWSGGGNAVDDAPTATFRTAMHNGAPAPDAVAAAQPLLSANDESAPSANATPSESGCGASDETQPAKRQKLAIKTSDEEQMYRSKVQQMERRINALSSLLETQRAARTTAERQLAEERLQHAEICKQHRLALAKSKQNAVKERQTLRAAMQEKTAQHAREIAVRDRDARLLLVRILKAKAAIQVES